MILASTEIMEIVFGELRQKIREQRVHSVALMFIIVSVRHRRRSSSCPVRLLSPRKCCIIPLRVCSPLPFISMPGNRCLARM